MTRPIEETEASAARGDDWRNNDKCRRPHSTCKVVGGNGAINVTTREWLNRAYRLDAEITQMEAAKKEMYARLTSASPRYTPGGGSSSPDPHKFDKYAAYAVLIDKRIEELIKIKEEIQAMIYNVADTRLRTLLIARYINFKTFEQIAVDMSYDWRHTMRLHVEALKAVEAIMS